LRSKPIDPHVAGRQTACQGRHRPQRWSRRTGAFPSAVTVGGADQTSIRPFTPAWLALRRPPL